MTHWFKKHPEILEQESQDLSNNSHYKELYQFRDNLFLSCGLIIVRLNTIHKFPILVVYEDSFPYSIPLIFPLNEVLKEEYTKYLSSLSILDLRIEILQKVSFYYHLRHQNQSGSLCILEWDSLDSKIEYFGIKSILERVKNWFRGTINGDFPKDSQEVSFASHFNDIVHEIQFLYPETFLDKSLIEGTFYCQLFKRIPRSIFQNQELSIYIGSINDGKGINGLYSCMNFNLPALSNLEITNNLDLIQKKPLIDQLLKSKELLKIYWFHIDYEPAPFQLFSELVNIIGYKDFNEGSRRICSLLYEDLKSLPELFLIALRFPNRKEVLEVQLFMAFQKEDFESPIVNSSTEKKKEYFINFYNRVAAIESEKFSDDQFHQRNSLRADRSILKNKAINILGNGAIGGEIADGLSKAGIGNILLLDNQYIKAHNAVRHLAGINYTGIFKVYSVEDLIQNHNPFVKIKTYPKNLNYVDLEDILIEDSISISSIADDNTEAFLNERGVILGKTIFYVRALRGGKVARIFKVTPGLDACLNCLNIYREEDNEFINIPQDVSLPTISNECNNPVRPASAADLKLISSLTSRILIDYLQSASIEFNHWIWSTEYLETPQKTLKAFTLDQGFLKPHSKCKYCSNDFRKNVRIKQEVIDLMVRLTLKDTSTETGGILIGQIEENNTIFITNASGPGPNAIMSANEFRKDVNYCQNFLDELFANSKGKEVYIGEWHSHPSKNNSPSNTDLKSLTEIASQKEYLTDSPVMIIVSNEGKLSCTIHPISKLYYKTEMSIV